MVQTEMYITSLNQLQEEISSRKKRSSQIQEKLDKWIKSEYGIDNYTNTIESYFNIQKSGKTVAALCRQIPSVTIEDISCYFFSKKIGLEPRAFPFIEDTFTSINSEKRSRVKIPWFQWSKKGSKVLQYEKVANFDLIEGLPLKDIQTKHNCSLSDYHFSLRNNLFGEKNYSGEDVSKLDRILVEMAQKKPEFVYVKDSKGFAIKVPFSEALSRANFRPPSKWYYPLYLSYFLNGSMVLLETYENEEGEVFEAKKLFESSMKKIRNATGLNPLILKIPPLNKNLMSINQHVIDDDSSLLKISMEIDGKVDFKNMEFVGICDDISQIITNFH